MIMSVEEFKTFVQSDLTDNVLEAKLQALELLIRRYTNNNFQKRAYRRTADIVGGSKQLVGSELGGAIKINGGTSLVSRKGHHMLYTGGKSSLYHICAPCTLVLMHSSGLYSAVSTCLMAAAWIITSTPSQARVRRSRSRTSPIKKRSCGYL